MIDAIAIVFICTAMNHMGLIDAIERRTRLDLPIIHCPKCASFWGVLMYCAMMHRGFISSVAIAFFCSYLSLWVELAMGYIDSIYLKCYEKIVSTADTDKASADAD